MVKHKKYIIITLVIALYIFSLVKYNVGIPCIFNKITGLYCPGCGGNRAITSFLHLNFYEAIRNNLIITLSIPLICIYFFIKYILKKNIKISNKIWLIILIITFVFAILRNIPLFNFLSPID